MCSFLFFLIVVTYAYVCIYMYMLDKYVKHP